MQGKKLLARKETVGIKFLVTGRNSYRKIMQFMMEIKRPTTKKEEEPIQPINIFHNSINESLVCIITESQP